MTMTKEPPADRFRVGDYWMSPSKLVWQIADDRPASGRVLLRRFDGTRSTQKWRDDHAITRWQRRSWGGVL